MLLCTEYRDIVVTIVCTQGYPSPLHTPADINNIYLVFIKDTSVDLEVNHWRRQNRAINIKYDKLYQDTQCVPKTIIVDSMIPVSTF